MLKHALVFILISNVFGSAYAFLYTEPEHIGALCTDCHNKYSFRQAGSENFSASVRNTDVIDMFPCYKKPCHFSSPVKWGGGGNRYTFHMRESICQNCHGKNGKYDIHKSHALNNATVNCNNCHASIMGWNSTHVEVPPYEEIYVAGSALLNTSIRVPKWGGDCGYCHITLKDANRQHDVHELVIEEACVECHGEIIESIPNPLKEAVIEGDAKPPAVRISLAHRIMQEYRMLFENISLQLLNFYNFILEE